nr:hypothetical protein [Micromonospora purpureochromogenes]
MALPRSPQEGADQVGDLVAVGLQREVAGVQQVDLRVGQVPGVRLGAGGPKISSFRPQVTSVGGWC